MVVANSECISLFDTRTYVVAAAAFQLGWEYKFEIRVRNAVGWSATSNSVSVDAPLPPPPPTIDPPLIGAIGITARTASSLTISIVDGNDRGNPILERDLEWQADGETTWEEITPSLIIAVYTIPGLDSDTQYTIRFATRNQGGWSPWHIITGSTLKAATAPSKILQTSLLAADLTNLQITWDAPNDGGSEILYYIWEYRIAGQVPPAAWIATQTNDNVVDIMNLIPDTDYDFRVKAVNAIGPAIDSVVIPYTTLQDTSSKTLIVHSLLTLTELDEHFWTGTGDLDYAGQIYSGLGDFLDLAVSADSLAPTTRRARARISTTNPALRAAVMQDTGPYEISAQWIWSEDFGKTWNKLPRSWVGRLSNPVLHDGIYEVEIETWQGDADLGYPLYWSDEDQKRRHPNDRGFEGLTILANGGLENITWPP